MPQSMFGAMNRSDHSFRPPMPEATIKFGSPNACNMCHTDKSPEWANKVVKQRKNSNYQEETLYWAELMRQARLNEWDRLDEILDIIKKEELNHVVVASFVRTLLNCIDEKKYPVLINAISSEHVLVRSSAASGLNGNTTMEVKNALLKACQDDYKVVRVAAANSLALFRDEQFTAQEKEVVNKATEEYMTSVVTRPDDWSSHYNLGLFYQNKGESDRALTSYETAARLYPESLMPLINSSVLYSYIGNNAKAEENLRKVIEIDPENEAANLNLGLLLAEQGRMNEAEQALRMVLKTNPEQAVAAYNLSVITSQKDINEAVKFAKIAAVALPEDPKYAYTLAFYQVEAGEKSAAVKTLNDIIKAYPQYLSAVSFLADIYIKDGKTSEAVKIYQKALKTEGLSNQDRVAIQQSISSLQRSM